MIDFKKLHNTLLSYKEHSIYKKRIKFESNVGSVIKEDGTFYSTESFPVWFKYKGYLFELDIIKTIYNNGQEISVDGDLISSPSEYLNDLNLRTGDVFNSIANSRLFDYASWEANMLIQTSKAKSAAAQQEAIRAEEEGKALAAKSKWEQERIKATEVTRAEQEYEVARLAALKAKEEAKRIEAEGQAKAAANRALVNAGLTPLEKATIEKETRIGVAEALAKTKWPTIVMSGGNGQNNAMDVIALKQMTDLVNNMSK